MTAFIKDEFHYLLPTPRDEQWGLIVTAAGLQCIPANVRFRSQGHSPAHDYIWQRGRVLHEYSIVYVIRGEAEFESEGARRRVVGEGSVILLFPDVWHRYRPVEPVGFDSYWVMFQGDYADRLREQEFITPREPILETGLDELILRPFRSLLDRVHGQPSGLQPLVAADVMAILAGVLSAVQRRRTTTQIHDAIRRAKIAIEAADDLPAIENIVKASGLGRSQFYQAFKSVAGMSPYQYHLQLRLSRARELLRSSAMPIKQIAATLKFNSVYQFSKIFAKKNGMPPTRYRRTEIDSPAPTPEAAELPENSSGSHSLKRRGSHRF
jgi:AraC-like DNA-binding protein